MLRTPRRWFPDQGNFRTGQNAAQKVLARCSTPGEVLPIEQAQRDVAAEPAFRAPELLVEIGDQYVADDQQIDVAGRMRSTLGDRAVDERDLYPGFEWLEDIVDDVANSECLRDQSGELGENRGVPVGLEVDLVRPTFARNQSGSGELVELTLHLARTTLSGVDDLPGVEGMVRAAEQQAEDSLTRLAEQRVGDGKCVRQPGSSLVPKSGTIVPKSGTIGKGQGSMRRPTLTAPHHDACLSPSAGRVSTICSGASSVTTRGGRARRGRGASGSTGISLPWLRVSTISNPESDGRERSIVGRSACMRDSTTVGALSGARATIATVAGCASNDGASTASVRTVVCDGASNEAVGSGAAPTWSG